MVTARIHHHWTDSEKDIAFASKGSILLRNYSQIHCNLGLVIMADNEEELVDYDEEEVCSRLCA